MRSIGGVIAIDDDDRALGRFDPLPGEDVGDARAPSTAIARQ